MRIFVLFIIKSATWLYICVCKCSYCNIRRNTRNNLHLECTEKYNKNLNAIIKEELQYWKAIKTNMKRIRRTIR